MIEAHPVLHLFECVVKKYINRNNAQNDEIKKEKKRKNLNQSSQSSRVPRKINKPYLHTPLFCLTLKDFMPVLPIISRSENK
jgi:hypothetical protein